ncbi:MULTISPECIES: ASCH domain-containing protein [unclassified Crossiella]|uniref:ASCH domain-containing protein n=1 Tax=unclassified Crossiella TaxID=2620835 RepID=UPI001FFF3671|nr:MULTISPECIES: ASCH domain-containing protein [unclassified Crossiella]MCK2245272.1 ASCH domain-containing protein [Crossiella sp. S99.2]MCK2258924.1 ASCH domain-containing protein [Crossiella sp. S99.1]
MVLSRNEKSALLVSPNSILANALLRSVDLLRPRVLAARPKRIEFVVGTQINGAPHLGTNLVQTAAFLLAKIARREFSVDTVVRFGALDNAPYAVDLDPETHHAYQQTYFHALGKDKIGELIEGYYQAFFRSLSEATDTEYVLETYTDQQASPGFRAEFLRTLERLEDIRWWMAPSHGVVHVRVPCSECGWAEKRADRTKLAHLDEDGAMFTAVCMDHGVYEVHIDPEDDTPYLDLATLYRNLVKERAFGRDPDVLHVMLKGGDWTFGCQLVDGALGALGTPAAQMPIRVFTPQVLAPTGAKLSKSLLREQGHGALPADVEPWMLDTTAWPGSVDDYVDALVWLVGELLTDPKHFFRSFTVKELGRLMILRPTEPAVRAHEMGIYKRYFDLIVTGRKTTEVRVNDSSRRNIRVGSLIRFNCQGDQVLTRVTKVSRYPSFEEMFDHEPVASVNPTATRDEQLANIRQIYPPEREALGVVAIGIELVDPPRSA